MADVNADIKAAFPGQEFKTGDQVQIGDQTYTKGEDGNFTASESTTSAGSKVLTPPTWDGPEDARKLPGAGKYPNFYVHKTRSGHTLIMDDSKGAEHVTLQHRGGSMVQLQPDGKLYISAQNGQYNITFGENRMKITGAYDISVDGAASLKIAKDYNVTVDGDINMTAAKNFNLTAQNFNQTIRGNIDVAAKNLTEKLEGSLMSQAKGSMTLASQGGFLAGSESDSTAIVGKNQLALLANDGELMARSGGKMSLESATGDIAIRTLTGTFSALGRKSVITGVTQANIEALSVDIIGAGAVQVQAGGAVGIGAVGAVGLTSGAAVSISAVGEVGLDAGAAIGILAGGAVGIESAAIGLNASMIASLGIIEQNGPVVVAVPPTPPEPVVPIPIIPVSPDNPKTAFMVMPAEQAPAETASDTTDYQYA
jgi:hypothetical protein